MSPSERAVGRRYTLRSAILDRLHSHQPLLDLLEQADVDVSDPGSVIMPSLVARRQRQHIDDPSFPDPPPVLITVAFVSSTSDRINWREDKTFSTQIGLEFRDRLFSRLRQSWSDEVQDEIDAVMTREDAAWIADGMTGGIPDPSWDDQINRWIVVERYDIRRRD